MKKTWMKILQQYKDDGFESVEVHLKNNEVFCLDLDTTILIAEQEFIFIEKGEIILIAEEDVKEIAI